MLMIIILSILFAFLDQASKYVVINYLEKEITVIKDFLYIVYTKNDGAAFNILSGERVFIILITILIIIGLLYFTKKRRRVSSKLEKLAYAFIIGGSLGNLIDRIVRGYVVDFILVKIFGHSFPVFNIGDALICIGAYAILIKELRKVAAICRLIR